MEQKEMPLLYNAASFFVYPSLYEGFGLPVLEAMACAKAVVTSGASSLPEIVGDAGLLINPYDSSAIYNAMRRLAEDSLLRKKMEDAAFERSKAFSWDKMARETLDIYQEIADMQRG
jgi:glycosyltransferase involved in cell wall biosynthesis